MVVVGEEAELLGLALAIVEDDGALPTPFLVVIELAEMSDDALARPGVGADALDEGVVGVLLAFFGPGVATQEHAATLLTHEHGQEALGNSRGKVFTTWLERLSTTRKHSKSARFAARNKGKSAPFFPKCARWVNRHGKPRLTEETIVAWADAHQARTGVWPTAESGFLPDAPGRCGGASTWRCGWACAAWLEGVR